MSPPWSRDRDDAEDRDSAGDDASGSDPPSPPGAAAAELGWDDDDLADDDLDDEAALEALADLLLAEDLLAEDLLDEAGDALPADPSEPTAPPLPADATAPYDRPDPADPASSAASSDLADLADLGDVADQRRPSGAAGPTPPGAPADRGHGVRARRFRRLGADVRAGWGRTGSASGLAPEARRAARHAHRPVHRRRSRHSFEPDDLTDVELDQLLRGPVVPLGTVGSVGLDEAGRQVDPGPPLRPLLAPGRSWPGWVTAAALGLLVVAALGLLRAAGGDKADTISTRGQSRPASGPVAPTPTPTPPPTTAAPTVPPTLPPPAAPATVASTPARGATALPGRAADAAAACHPSYDPCVPVAADVDCFGGQGNGPAYAHETVEVTGDDVYALDADHDGQGCE